ncbi:MAG TPA: porin family protein [Bacteroidales bacterium]|nr:porin family protein [Bacteroidales bacterium]
MMHPHTARIQKTSARILLLFLLGMALPLLASAQHRPQLNLPKYDLKQYHFGFILGINQMFFSVNNVEEFDKMDSLYKLESTPELGFNIGIVSNLRLAEYWDLRFIPTLSFGERNLNYTFMLRNKQFYEDKKKVESTHIDLPLVVKFKSQRLNNFRAYILGGAKYSIDLASQAKKKESDDELRVKIERNDLALETGVGFDFYTTYFKFGTELKMSYGINDVLKQENTIYTRGIESMRSKIFQISFTFE